MEDPASHILPLGTSLLTCIELIDKCIGSQVWIVMKDGREFVGQLCGFDDYVNVVLDKTVQYTAEGEVGSGRYDKQSLGQILLNGTNICLLIPGDTGPHG